MEHLNECIEVAIARGVEEGVDFASSNFSAMRLPTFSNSRFPSPKIVGTKPMYISSIHKKAALAAHERGRSPTSSVMEMRSKCLHPLCDAKTA